MANSLTRRRLLGLLPTTPPLSVPSGRPQHIENRFRRYSAYEKHHVLGKLIHTFFFFEPARNPPDLRDLSLVKLRERKKKITEGSEGGSCEFESLAASTSKKGMWGVGENRPADLVTPIFLNFLSS